VIPRRRSQPLRVRVCRRLIAGAAATLRRARRALTRRGPRVQVLMTDRARARAIRREVHAALRALRHALGPAVPDELVVVVQQVVRADRPLVGCYEVARRPDGGRFVLVRVALSVGPRKLGTDEVLAALADQVVALADVGPREVVPLELAAPPAAAPSVAAPPEPARPAALQGDPLAARSHGHTRGAA
jgi:hypothetical protein